jgi:large subunit ribosomal protein L21
MDYAVIRTGGKQYRVAPGDLVRVEKIEAEPGAEVQFEEVLAARQGEAIQVGAPLLAGARVTATVVRQDRAKKILIYKKKRRKNYRRRQGHRQYYTAVRVTGIQLGA